jgi:hypothetical protein
MEDGNSQLETPLYRGYWYTAADPTGDGDLTPEPGMEEAEDLDPARGDSTRAMHVYGEWTDGDDWAAAIGFAFNPGDAPVEASAFSGISFHVKSDEPATDVKVQLMITTVTDDAHFEYELSSLHDLSSSWQKITIHFDEAGSVWDQPSWKLQTVAFNPDNLYKVQFQFTEDPFDLWIDDVRFELP